MLKYIHLDIFSIGQPNTNRVPILIGFPHSGHYIPPHIKSTMNANMLANMDDVDWYLPKLYDFAHDLGITTIEAHLCRWVIDLNRDPANQPLYSDGRLITGLCPITDFLGNALYLPSMEPDAQEIGHRLAHYYWPYYEAIQGIIHDFIHEFGIAILYDAHSIRSVVPSIQAHRFSDCILGTNRGLSADKALIDLTVQAYAGSAYRLQVDTPFSGGHITRYFGNPAKHQHALQLERCKDLYMDSGEKEWEAGRAQSMREHLMSFFQKLIKYIGQNEQ